MKFKLILILAACSVLIFPGCGKKEEAKPISRIVATNQAHNFVVIKPTPEPPFKEGSGILVMRNGRTLAEGIAVNVSKEGTVIDLNPASAQEEFPSPGDYVFSKP